MTNRFKYILVACLLLGFCGATFYYNFFDIKTLVGLSLKPEELEEICEARGGLDSPGPIAVDGYYQESASPLFGTEEVMARLGKRRFQFLEMDSDWVKSNHTWGKFNLKKVQGKGKYFRFYLAHRGDPNCEAYEEYIGDQYDSAKSKLFLRSYGIYPESCFAAIMTDERKSKYGFAHYNVEDSENPKVSWNVLSFQDLETGEDQSRYNSFTYCYAGVNSEGYCRGWGQNRSFSCRPKVEGYNNPTNSVYRGSFKATPNPYLKKKLVTKEIHGPFDIKETRVVPELIEKIGGERNIPRVRGDAVKDWYDCIEMDGYGHFSERAVSWEEGDKKYKSLQPQIVFINDSGRKLLKTDIDFADPRKRKSYDYCCLRAEKDGVYFIAWGGRQELTEKANNFKIIKYSWDGVPEKILAGTLPFQFQVSGGSYHAYANLRIEKNYIYFPYIRCRMMAIPISTSNQFTITDLGFPINRKRSEKCQKI
ncbi:hypothetical protein [Desulfopila sp. IMCC35008]|uniref:hypothetical protein n=1 Tax=Desulfopila sp. IMCC35008 TaxID=2653858 RepID=UPI0013D7F2D1|nr:hypothetical protein [Desulfopila sp. IMCC35008]